MNNCKHCGAVNNRIITETTFGHGDSSHECLVRCSCGSESPQTKETFGPGLWSESAFREAQRLWNEQNEKKETDDKVFLQWIYDRLVEVHGENPNYDYMHKLRAIIAPDKYCPHDTDKDGNCGVHPNGCPI